MTEGQADGLPPFLFWTNKRPRRMPGPGGRGRLTASGAALAKWQVLLRLTMKMMP